MFVNNIDSKPFSHESVTFRERSHCISCGSSKLHPLWQGQFNEEPIYSFIQRCHYSKDVLGLVGKETFSLVRCETCGMTFHQRILSPQGLNLLYSQWIDDDQIKHMEVEYRTGSPQEIKFERGREYTRHLLRLQTLLKGSLKEPFRILDYGCGDGYFLALAKLFGFDTYGIDFSSVRIEQSAKQGIAIFENLESLKSSQFPSMHIVTLFQVLEHLEEPLEILHKIANVMEDGGILIIEVPNCQGITQPHNFSEFHAVHPLEHINTFTPTTLKRICEQAGFIPIKRIAAHGTTSFVDVLRTEVSRFIQPSQTSQYFRLHQGERKNV
jgi:2-polyprenyl-3-methyl-5-hydroxy-6-metoxy-1,4-benzoquinol methylase